LGEYHEIKSLCPGTVVYAIDIGPTVTLRFYRKEMGLISDSVRELLDATGWHLPRMRPFIIGALLAIAVLFPASFSKGVISWSNQRACSLESEYVPLVILPNIPEMRVLHQRGRCIVVPSATVH